MEAFTRMRDGKVFFLSHTQLQFRTKSSFQEQVELRDRRAPGSLQVSTLSTQSLNYILLPGC